MKQTRAIEIGTGLFVLLGLAALFFMVTEITAERVGVQREGYEVTAKFEQIGGLKIGAQVSMSGVTIGRVVGISFDQTDYRAHVKLRIDPEYSRIPSDSDAAILTQGLLGNQYVGLGAGSSETFLKQGDEIEFTQPAVVLENLISKFLYSLGSKNKDDNSETPKEKSK